jgi:hypothetical protein
MVVPICQTHEYRYRAGRLLTPNCDFVVVIMRRVLQQGRGLFSLVLEGHLGWVALFFQ